MKRYYMSLLFVIVVSAIGAAQSESYDLPLEDQSHCDLCRQMAKVQRDFPLVYEQLMKAQWALQESIRAEQQLRNDYKVLAEQLQAACQDNQALHDALEQEHLLRKKETVTRQSESEEIVLLQKKLHTLFGKNQALRRAWHQLQADRDRIAWRYLLMQEAAVVDGRRADAVTRALNQAHKNVRFLENESKCLGNRVKKGLREKRRAKAQLRTAKEQLVWQENRIEHLESQLKNAQGR